MIYVYISFNFNQATRHKSGHQLLANWQTQSSQTPHHRNSKSKFSSSFSFSLNSSSSCFECCCCCCLICVSDSRLCQTCVSVCGNNASWFFRSCLVNVSACRHIKRSSNSIAGHSQLSVCPVCLGCWDTAADAPYMLSIPSALRLKSAGDRRSERGGAGFMWKSGETLMALPG